MKYLLALLLIATPAFADDLDDMVQGLTQIRTAYAQLDVKAGQAGLASAIDNGLVELQKKLVELKKEKTKEPKKEEKK